MNESKAERFRKECAPFYIVEQADGSYSLCYAMDLTHDPHYEIWQEAFNRYADETGEPRIEKSGIHTHGSGYEWEEAFKKAFENDANISRITFNCEANGFFCDAPEYEMLEDFGRRFYSICNDSEGFAQLVSKALSENAIRDKEEAERLKTMIKPISEDELRRMGDSEGLILQGCGGSPVEWLKGINSMLKDEGILKDGTNFSECLSFNHNGVACLLFPFGDDVKIDAGKLAVWRLKTHEHFGGTWLSDYVPNKLGGFIPNDRTADKAAKETEKAPKHDCPIIGRNGNIFNLMGIAAHTLSENGLAEQSREMCNRIYEARNYSEALGIISEYVNITSVGESLNESESDDEGMQMT